MYKYLDIAKTYALRIIFRKLRAVLLLIIPMSFILIPSKSRPYLYALFCLGLILFVLDIGRKKKQFQRSKPSSIDWIIVIGTNFYIAGIVFLTGGSISPLMMLLLVPTLFTMEFGFSTGVVNLIFLAIFSLLDLLLFKEQLINKINLLALLFLAGLTLILLTSLNKILTRYNRKIVLLLTQDDLTGLYNRRFLKTKVLEYISQRRPFSLIMLDINFFKYYNDHWGHTMGDSLLISIGRILKRGIKDGGIVVRTSGDEFIILILRSSPDDPEDAAEEVKQLLEGHHFPGEECFPKQKLTISYGTVSYPDQANYYEDLMEKVDQKLYQNKKIR